MHKFILTAALAAIALSAQPICAAGFVADSKATLGLRNFYINQDTRNANVNSQAEWGQGFQLNYSSGYSQGSFGVGVDAIGLLGIKLDSGKGRHYNPNSQKYSGSVFPTDEDGRAVDQFGSLGLTGKLRFSNSEARLGTLQPKLPVAVFSDGRLLPQTFTGGQITSNELDNLSLIGGQLEHVKGRNSSNNEGLSISGANNAQTGRFSNSFYYGGADYKISQELSAQYYYGNLQNFYQQHFIGLLHNWAIGSGTVKSDLRYFKSSSQGKNSTAAGRADGYVSNGYYGNGVSKGEVDNNTWSALFTYTLGSHALSAGYQNVSGDSAFPFLNQGDGAVAYLITDRQIGKFLNAGEHTWLAEYGYDFSHAGVPGLKAIATYLSGSNIASATGDKQEWERDLRLDYLLQEGPLKGLGCSWRNAILRGNSSTADGDENRLILSYTLPLS